MSTVGELVELIERLTGIVVPERDLARFESLVQEIALRRTGGDLDALLGRLRRHRSGRDWRTLLAAITVKESYLFRSPRQFEVLAQAVLPELARLRPERQLAVWCAGCARGEEAATLAIVLADSEALAGWQWRILATDLDENALDDARAGRFGRRAVARVPAAARERYLRQHGDAFELVGSLRRRIEYRQLNLVQTSHAAPGAPYDIILLRNVLIYFRPETQLRVVQHVTQALAEDGFLFLGPSESLLQHDVPVQPIDLGGCFVYRRRQGDDAREPQPVTRQRAVTEKAATPVTPLHRPARRPTATGKPVPPPDDPAAAVRSLLEAGSFGRAAALGVEQSEREPDNHELRALTALAIDRVGDDAAAVRAYRAVLYLEPTLFQIRHRLAETLRRQGRLDRAESELQGTLSLITSGRGRALPHWRELGLQGAEEVAEACREALR